jgi:RNA polymerase sigma-70 factor (ECF subfamily)
MILGASKSKAMGSEPTALFGRHPAMPGEDRWRGTFDDLYAAAAPAVLAYAARRTDTLDDAEDVAAETFAIAWRRLEDCPAVPRAWLFGIARRVLANRYRSASRWRRLSERLFHATDHRAQRLTMEGGPATAALSRMREADRELLRLVAWEGLDHAEIGIVLGITPNAVAIRLHRARQRFTDELRRSEPHIVESRVKGIDPRRTSAAVNGIPNGKQEELS